MTSRVLTGKPYLVTDVAPLRDGRFSVVVTMKGEVHHFTTDLPPRVGEWVADPESRS